MSYIYVRLLTWYTRITNLILLLESSIYAIKHMVGWQGHCTSILEFQDLYIPFISNKSEIYF